jgi:uncharacterized protein
MSDNSFLGRGWSFPPEFINNGRDVKMVSDEEDINQSLKILLSTSMNERLMHPDFYCDMNNFSFENIDYDVITSLKSTIKNCILYNEPRIALEKVEINQAKDNLGLLMINISYTIRTINIRQNMVYPFYLNEK